MQNQEFDDVQESADFDDEKSPPPAAPTPQSKNTAPVKPNIRLRQNMTFEHHLFGSDVQECLKNVSYKKFQPDLKKLPHKHFFHTKDMRGKALNKSSHACGHYHIMQWYMDAATGNLIAKSGPALRDATVKLLDGSRTSQPEECTWMDKNRKVTQDTHVHVWEYLGTDVLSPGILKQNREANQEEASSYGVQVNQTVKPMGQSRLRPEDGFDVVVK